MIASGEIEVDAELQQLAQRAMDMGVAGTVSPKMQQDEQDRRLANMEYERERLRAEAREPITGAEWQALFRRHGFEPKRPLSDAAAEETMSYDAFTNRIVSCTLMTRYEAQGEPDAPRTCDNCNMRGAKMRCSNCGEYYCNPTCAKRHWSEHREVCCKAGPRRPRTVPLTMDEEEYAVRVLGKPPLVPAPTPARPGSWAAAAAASPPPPAALAPTPAPGTGKNAKKNKKKREKAKAAKAASGGTAGEGEKEDGDARAAGAGTPAYENVD